MPLTYDQRLEEMLRKSRETIVRSEQVIHKTKVRVEQSKAALRHKQVDSVTNRFFSSVVLP